MYIAGICLSYLFKFIFFSSRISSTQPEPRIRNDSADIGGEVDEKRDWSNVCFSQPLHVDDLILTQTQQTPGSSQVINDLLPYSCFRGQLVFIF